ncbi:MAG: FHA domain-containing protein [Pseudomonadota bacterium]
MSANLLALIEALDRHGNVQARLPVTEWPVTVGRDLAADLVLDDVHVAALHLRLEQVAPGCLDVQVLDTHNGATLGTEHHGHGMRFDWIPGQALTLGRTHLQLRLADSPVAAEQPLPQWHWRNALWTIALVTAAMLLTLGQVWFKSIETSQFLQTLPITSLGFLAGLSMWAGLWALATKLFSGHPQFWRHIRIACAIVLASFAVETVLELLAFAFSWEVLARFDNVTNLLVLAAGMFRHLLVVAPRQRYALTLCLGLLLLLGVPTMLGTQWLKNKRLSQQLYMSQLFPPAWRVAEPVPVAQFLQEAASIEKRLAVRLADKDDNGGSDKAGTEED